MGQANENRGLGQFKESAIGHCQENEFYSTSYEEPGKIVSQGVLRSEVLY